MSGLVEAAGTPALPWLLEPLRAALRQQRGHAVLVHGAPGDGALSFALALAQSWLCEAPQPDGLACGRCDSCRQAQGRVHADLFVLLPETLRRETGWPLDGDKAEDDGKRKPSRQIRIAEVRSAIDWVGRTAARGRGKAWVLHPAEALNEQSASALLKTAEEPPAGTRLVLTCTDPLAILPTVRSRCHTLRLPTPAVPEALAWLQARGVVRAEVLLAAAGGRALDALALQAAGIDAAAWESLPERLAQGHAGAFSGWPVPRALDALSKLCHDALAHGAGAPCRYFSSTAMPGRCAPERLARLARELQALARHAEHPWHEGLQIDALAARARVALAPTSSRG